MALVCGSALMPAQAQVSLLAKGTLTSSAAGPYKDLSGLNGTLENGVPANLLGGLGSGIAYASGDTFLSVPDRGPNAVSYNSAIDDTASYIPRVQTIRMNLEKNTGTGLPFTISPKLVDTTLLASPLPLVYGDGTAYGVPSGRPKQNTFLRNYFTGRSDNFDPNRSSGDVRDARLDPESIRLSNDGLTYFISDEYGPYVYQFLRGSGERIRTFNPPNGFDVAHPATTTDSELAANSTGRVPNKGMEGLAITPDGRKLLGILQTATIEDSNAGGAGANLLRMALIDIASGRTVHEYGYLLTTGSGVSDIVALNDHEFLVDERDGKGLGDGSKAKIKQLFKIDIDNATDITGMDGNTAATVAVPKTLFLDIVKVLGDNGIIPAQVPAKLEGLAFGPDVKQNGRTVHTLWVANDNDFLQDYGGVAGSNPNQFFVFGFTESDLAGSQYVPQGKGGLRGLFDDLFNR
ncbi:esterase-like activity of phytase family protein [Edaphobacter sp. HDX4]|uniref:esterase-like activity of phytase family protein n=1 Tax=Edaphobacter sp. HDX4 TaxID=2794064 RepID=UPI002FE5486B